MRRGGASGTRSARTSAAIALAVALATGAPARASASEPAVPEAPAAAAPAEGGAPTGRSPAPATSPQTEAAPAERVLVLPLATGATVDPGLREELQAALERGLGRGHLLPLRDAAADACVDDEA